MSRALRRGCVAAAAIVLLCVLALATPARAAHGDTTTDADALSESSVVSGLDQSVLDSAAAEIQSQLDLEAELNARVAEAGTEHVVEAGSEQAAELADPAALRSPATAADAFAFLSQDESPRSDLAGVDVEQHLDTIATELDSLFKTDAQVEAEKQAKAAAEARANSRAGRAEAKRARAKALREARERARREAAQMQAQQQAAESKQQAQRSAAPAAGSKPSARQQKLVARLDGYRTARGHQDVSTLEATAQARSTSQNGYSMPVVPLGPAAPVAAPFPGAPIGVNPLLAPAWLGVPPQQQAVQAQPAPATNVAGVGALLQALSSLLRPAAPAPQALPPVVPSPFNYGQALVATPAGYANPNLLPPEQLLVGPRVLPGAIPGMSPAYPSFIPPNQASVGVEAEQPNPFEAHAP